jgi:hypothetical protein
MRRILVSSTLVTAVLAGCLLLAPNFARAATAHEKFATMRSALAKAFSDGELTITGTVGANNAATFKVMLDGSPLPPDIPVTVTGEKIDGGTDYTIKIDFSDSNFSTIEFGKDQDTLKLVPKASPNQVDIVRLDPKTGKPLTWTEFKNGSAEPTRTIAYRSKPGHTGKSTSSKQRSAPAGDVVTAHMRIVSN